MDSLTASGNTLMEVLRTPGFVEYVISPFILASLAGMTVLFKKWSVASRRSVEDVKAVVDRHDAHDVKIAETLDSIAATLATLPAMQAAIDNVQKDVTSMQVDMVAAKTTLKHVAAGVEQVDSRMDTHLEHHGARSMPR